MSDNVVPLGKKGLKVRDGIAVDHRIDAFMEWMEWFHQLEMKDLGVDHEHYVEYPEPVVQYFKFKASLFGLEFTDDGCIRVKP